MSTHLKIRVPATAAEPRGSIAVGVVVAGSMRFAKWLAAAWRRGRSPPRR